MKKTLFFVLFLSASTVFAQTTTNSTTTPALVATTQAITVASVNVSNITATKTATSTYTISFSVSTSDSPQSGILYNVSLIDKNDEPIATYTFDKELSLAVGTSTRVTEGVTIPKGLSGSYSFLVRALTGEGLPLGIVISDPFEVKDQELVKLESCTLNKNSYETSEILEISCIVKEVKKGSLIQNTNGGYVVKGKAFYRNKPKEQEEVLGEITNGKAILSFKNLKDPGSYTIYTSLYERGGSPVGKQLDSSFTINGIKVSILNSLLDKDYYTKGEQALATISLDVVTSGTTSPQTLTANLSGEAGVCAENAVREATNGAMRISFVLQSDCVNPTLTTTITNAINTTLASSTISRKSTLPVSPVVKTPEPSTNSTDKMIYGSVGLLGLLVGLASVFIARRRVVNN